MLSAPIAGGRQLGPLVVVADTVQAARCDIVSAVCNKTPLRVAFANTHLIYCALRDRRFAELMRSFYVVNDGVGVDLLSRLSCGQGFVENLNGTDLTPQLLHAMPWGTRIMLVGSRPEVVQTAAARVTRAWPHLDVCAHHDGFEGKTHALEALDEIKPNVVLVGMGNPLQEEWIASAAQKLPNAVFLGVGALFDFIAGAVPRAPQSVRRLRLEWAFRLAREPDRMWRRYTVELAIVFASVISSSLTKRAA
jgi:exopolysaccharide biosynthesis WecB/TagA/CpsF family protein